MMNWRNKIVGFLLVTLVLFLGEGVLAGPDYSGKTIFVDHEEYRSLLPHVVALKAKTPPIIDGKLDDEVWLETAIYGSETSGFTNHAGTALAKQETLAYLAYDEDNIYLAIVAFKSDMEKLQSEARTHDTDVDQDDSVELFFDSTYGDGPVHHLTTNSLGTKSDAIVRDFSWNPNWAVATQKLSDRWISEIAIPFAELGLEKSPIQGEVWGFNIHRNDISSQERSSWSPTYSLAIIPELFGNLIFGSSIKAPYEHAWEVEHQVEKKIASGVSHTSLNLYTNQLKQAIQISAINLKDPHTEVLVASSKNSLGHLETMRNIAQEHIDQDQKVIAAVNGDFFSRRGLPSGMQIIDGEIISSPAQNKAGVLIMDDGSVELVSQIKMDAFLIVDTKSLGVDAINRVLGSSHNKHLYVYTSHFGKSTEVESGNVEVVLEFVDPEAKLKAEEKLVARVVQINENGNTIIPEQGLVLTATGSKADWLRTHLKPNIVIELHVSYNQEVEKAKHVLGGNGNLSHTLLKDGFMTPEILNREDPIYNARHPRTLVATKADQLYIIVIDGRQAGYSNGVTLAEAAHFLLELGMEQAINVDGGGSSTYLYRPLGESELTLANRPSDKLERPVINGFLVINTAPTGPLTQLFIEPGSEGLVLKGSSLDFVVKGVDQNLNPVVVEREDLNWQFDGSIGTITESGKLLVNGAGDTGILRVFLDDIETAIQLTSTETIADLTLQIDNSIVKTNSTVLFQPKATALDGSEVLLSADALEWSVEGEIGEINQQGELQTSSQMKSGTVIARYGEHEASLKLYVMD